MSAASAITPSFPSRLAASWPAEKWSDVDVLVAVSGGADSTALLCGLRTLQRSDARGKLIAAHFNHRLRGAESDADEAFVVALAEQIGASCVVGRGDVGSSADRRGDGIEEAARDARYRFLVETAAAVGARYVVTAHTLDDQAETVLHRILRGTGLTGLSGIPRVRALVPDAVGLVRPMLTIRRGEVVEYLKEIGRPYREDSSNDDLRYTRNRIRHELLPMLARDYNPRIVEVLARLAAQAEETQALVDRIVEPLARQADVFADYGTWRLECSSLVGQPRQLVRELFVRLWTDAGLPLQGMGYEEWQKLAEMACGTDSAPRVFPGNVTVRRFDDRLVATRAASSSERPT